MTAPATTPKRRRTRKLAAPSLPADVRLIRIVEGTYVNAVEDGQVYGRWHIATPAKAGETTFRLSDTFRGTLEEAKARVREWDILVGCARGERGLPCVA